MLEDKNSDETEICETLIKIEGTCSRKKKQSGQTHDIHNPPLVHRWKGFVGWIWFLKIEWYSEEKAGLIHRRFGLNSGVENEKGHERFEGFSQWTSLGIGSIKATKSKGGNFKRALCRKTWTHFEKFGK